jgi:tRNA pseudouridine(38-40) synthase
MPESHRQIMTLRVALGIEYDGTAYHGWQRQKNATGIQSIVEGAISAVANEAIETICAGRTDAGVHATAQVVHFDCHAVRPTRNWLLGVNANLPEDINVTWAAAVDENFHARYSATVRTYRYRILNRRVRSGLTRQRASFTLCDDNGCRKRGPAAHGSKYYRCAGYGRQGRHDALLGQVRTRKS